MAPHPSSYSSSLLQLASSLTLSLSAARSTRSTPSLLGQRPALVPRGRCRLWSMGSTPSLLDQHPALVPQLLHWRDHSQRRCSMGTMMARHRHPPPPPRRPGCPPPPAHTGRIGLGDVAEDAKGAWGQLTGERPPANIFFIILDDDDPARTPPHCTFPGCRPTRPALTIYPPPLPHKIISCSHWHYPPSTCPRHPGCHHPPLRTSAAHSPSCFEIQPPPHQAPAKSHSNSCCMWISSRCKEGGVPLRTSLRKN